MIPLVMFCGTSITKTCLVGSAALLAFATSASASTVYLDFAGIARSVVFGGTANQQMFDDFTFGSTTVGGIPEPAGWAMMIGGFALVGAAMRRRRITAAFA